jgi:hypothetical protein
MEILLSLGLGAVASWLQGAKASKLKKWQRYFVSLLACIIAGGISTVLQLLSENSFSPEMLLQNVGTAFLASQTFYNLYFKK